MAQLKINPYIYTTWPNTNNTNPIGWISAETLNSFIRTPVLSAGGVADYQDGLHVYVCTAGAHTPDTQYGGLLLVIAGRVENRFYLDSQLYFSIVGKIYYRYSLNHAGYGAWKSLSFG